MPTLASIKFRRLVGPNVTLGLDGKKIEFSIKFVLYNCLNISVYKYQRLFCQTKSFRSSKSLKKK